MANQTLRQCLGDTTPYMILLILISTIGSLQFGYHMAELNAPQDVITCRKKSIAQIAAHLVAARRNESSLKISSLPQCIPMNEAQFATISSMFTLGGLLGALCAGSLSSRHGRLPTMRSTSVLYVLGSLVETLSGAIYLMAIGRLFSGIAAGAATVIVPLYISEVAPPSQRGLFGAMTQISANFGILISQTLGYFLSYDDAWRWILGVGVCIGGVHGLGLFVVPESPAWLAVNGHVTAARRILQRIRGKDVDMEDEIQERDGFANESSASRIGEGTRLLAQNDETPQTSLAEFSKPAHMGFLEVIKDPECRPAIVAVVGVMLSQQFCGINSVVMYSVSLLADLLPFSSALLTILISVVNLGTTVACSPLPDRLGRKKCLLLSIVGQGSSSLVLALSIVYEAKILSAIAVLFFVAFFAVGLGPVPFILASELVSKEAVGATQSWALGSSYVATFLVAQFFPIINKALNNTFGGHGWVYFLFAALAVGCGLFVSWRVPETMGKKDANEVWGRARRID